MGGSAALYIQIRYYKPLSVYRWRLFVVFGCFLFYLAIIASLYINANQKTTRLLKESGQNSKGEFKIFDELECSSSELISLYDYDPMREYELRLESEIEITNGKLWPDEDEEDKPKKRRRSSGRRKMRATKKAV